MAYTPSDIFFIISSIGFVTLWILVAVLLVYIIRTMHTFSRIIQKLENNLDTINETAKDLLLDIRESVVFNFLFGKKRKSRRNTKATD